MNMKNAFAATLIVGLIAGSVAQAQTETTATTPPPAAKHAKAHAGAHHADKAKKDAPAAEEKKAETATETPKTN